MAYDFDTIAARYDGMNHLMTLGLDRCWRKRVVRALPQQASAQQRKALDVACGTGDMAVLLHKHGMQVTAVDISTQMLAIAQHKSHSINWQTANAEQLPYPDATFHAVTCAFGVRNFANLTAGLTEMLRVLRPGGTLAILELSTPDNALVRPLYTLYARHIIPLLGSAIAGNRQAYTYLPLSIEKFIKGKDFTQLLHTLGAQAAERKLLFGVCRLYTATKR